MAFLTSVKSDNYSSFITMFQIKTRINKSIIHFLNMQESKQEENSYFNRMKQGCERLKTIIFQRSENPLDITSVLFGYLLSSFDQLLHQDIVSNYIGLFGQLKRRVKERLLREVDAIIIVYDIIEELKAIERGVSSNRVQDLRSIFESNMRQMTSDKNFMMQRWKLQQQEFEKQVKRQTILQKQQERLLSQRAREQEAEARRSQQQRIQRQQRSQVQRQREELEYYQSQRIPTKQQKLQTCFICNAADDPKELTQLNCSHSFHPECLRAHIDYFVSMNITIIICPMRDCSYKFQDHQIKHYLDATFLKRYQENQVFEMVSANLDKMSWCPGLHCRNIAEYEPGTRTFNCETCNKLYCLRCRLQHINMSCTEYQAMNGHAPIRFNLYEPKFKRCQRCNEWVERRRESLRAQCRCGHHFCFNCQRQGCRNSQCGKPRQIVIDIDDV